MKQLIKKTAPWMAGIFLSLISLPCQAQWQILDDLPIPVAAIDPVVFQDKIYLFGGKMTEMVSSDTVWIYDAETGWAPGGKMPDSLEAIITEEYNGLIYLFGGHSHPDFVYRDEVMTYDPATQIFDTVAYLPVAKAWFTSVVLHGKIYLIGGNDGSGSSNAVDIFDPASGNWADAPPMQTTRAGLSADTLNGQIYVTGGGAGTTAFGTVEIYDPVGGGWTTSPTPMLHARAFHACKNVGGKLYLLGGVYSFSEPFQSNVEYFDPQAGEWIEFDTMNFARRELGAAILDGDLFAIGGAKGPLGNGNYLSKFEKYDILSAGHEVPVLKSFDPQLNSTPNPFHPTTRILFTLSKRSKTSLDIIDINGRKVATLVNGMLNPGQHEAVWDGSGSHAGVYFYRLRTEEFMATGKCVLNN